MLLPSIIVNGDTITIPNMDPLEAHRVFSEIILDGLLPVWAPIGFETVLFTDIQGGQHQVYSKKNTGAPTMLNRGSTFQETALAISTNLLGTVFTGLHAINRSVRTEEHTGPIYSKQVKWIEYGYAESGVYAQTVDDKYFATSFEKVQLDLYVMMSTGYRTMQENAKILKGDLRLYTPIASEHTLNRYVRVAAFPNADGSIKVQYLKGMTPALFKQLWEEGASYVSEF